MGKSRHTKKILLDVLEGKSSASIGKKELKQAVKAKDPSLGKSVNKALRKLVQKGKIVKDGDSFRTVMHKDMNSLQEGSSSTTVKLSSTPTDVVPIAARLRKEFSKVPATKKSVSFASDEPVDLDDEILRLEAELQRSSDSESSSDEDEDGEAEHAPTVLSLSAFANDRIDNLPETALPDPGKYKVDGSTGKKRKKRSSSEGIQGPEKIDGLKEAVKEVLSGYKPRSSERLPFYCRFCSKQYSNEAEFFQHKDLDFHKTAVQMERKATLCRLCRKQLTSPDQMKEHLKSRPHKERLERARMRQGANRGPLNNNRGRQWG